VSEALDVDQVEGLLELALAEDVGPRDLTTELVVPRSVRARATLVAREEGVLAGGPLVSGIYRKLGGPVTVRFQVEEGEVFTRDEALAELHGPAGVLLTGERLALNFLQRLSGVATMTRRFTEAVRSYDVKVLDTRKTTPGWRYLEKYAVRMGGGTNHRMGLYDQVLIKDNHIACVRPMGLLAELGTLVKETRRLAPEGTVIEIEVQDLDQLKQALGGEPDIILLDNMSPELLSQAVQLVREKCAGKAAPVLEASGGVTLESVSAIAATGVDCISVGQLTHSAPAVDIALELTVE
jgi:nicotinate-nucleotide pyrophosphorylase (carboxylating)